MVAADERRAAIAAGAPDYTVAAPHANSQPEPNTDRSVRRGFCGKRLSDRPKVPQHSAAFGENLGIRDLYGNAGLTQRDVMFLPSLVGGAFGVGIGSVAVAEFNHECRVQVSRLKTLRFDPNIFDSWHFSVRPRSRSKIARGPKRRQKKVCLTSKNTSSCFPLIAPRSGPVYAIRLCCCNLPPLKLAPVEIFAWICLLTRRSYLKYDALPSESPSFNVG